ncbi:negative transcriptional regulator, PaiB family [Ferrithrix thermotolerans DSM 19514]|uniref:Negative transcriptional regulator, PaiB family n=1 Tax=Ferrithrix thermotolerans DSM 19514 TaxID=1121881 RepID=A0A1M4U8V0_9ACTN|nr:FMN-binding negative transcriptional regulator [Ferrithrix thermotolerans]SHE53169.1 negative transcriptional regulator, PaiB family [Ferrithrix thermotolerans DSM 19514]
MYIPRHFQPRSQQETLDVLRNSGASDLISYSDNEFQLSTLPFVVDEEGDVLRLLGHLARANPHWRCLDGSDAFVLVHGPSAYVSPSVYPSKVEHQKVVPTWNYVKVALRGTVQIHEEPSWIETVVTRLTEKFEVISKNPWNVSDAPRDFIDSQLRAVVGVEFLVRETDAKFKLSQNRDLRDAKAVRDDMARRAEIEMYEAMGYLKDL